MWRQESGGSSGKLSIYELCLITPSEQSRLTVKNTRFEQVIMNTDWNEAEKVGENPNKLTHWWLEFQKFNQMLCLMQTKNK